jgi:hypothetical protein
MDQVETKLYLFNLIIGLAHFLKSLDKFLYTFFKKKTFFFGKYNFQLKFYTVNSRQLYGN